jgi:hypothetical protein
MSIIWLWGEWELVALIYNEAFEEHGSLDPQDLVIPTGKPGIVGDVRSFGERSNTKETVFERI